MNEIMTICRTTCTRVLRTRSLYLLLGSVLVLVAVAHLYNDLSAGRQKELMYDAGAGLLTLVGLLTSLVITFDISRDLREKVVMVLLSKPLGRTSYLLGKFLGVVWLVTVNIAIVTVGVMFILKWEMGVWRVDFLQVAITAWGAMLMTTALGMVFVTFFNELPAALLTILSFVLFNNTTVLFKAGGLPSVLGGLLPNFGLLNFTVELGNELAVSWGLVVGAVVYAVVYSMALVSLSTVIFQKRDIA